MDRAQSTKPIGAAGIRTSMEPMGELPRTKKKFLPTTPGSCDSKMLLEKKKMFQKIDSQNGGAKW